MPNKDSQYYKTVKIPVTIKSFSKGLEKTGRKTYGWLAFRLFKKSLKITTLSALVLVIIISQSLLSKAYEAHVINVTAHICRYSETRTIGYWKNHPEVYDPALLPQFVGTDLTCSWYRFVDSQDVVNEVLDTSNPKGKDKAPKDMHIQLRAQLLGMKFNIAYFGIGGYFVESEGQAIDQIVAAADILLCDPNATRKDLEEMKNILDYLNNLHQLRYCATITSVPIQTIQSAEEEIVVTERLLVPYCEPASQQSCFTGLQGICNTGNQICNAEGSAWGECIQINQPVDEICDDGLDNNCNGLIDCDDTICSENETCKSSATTAEEQATTTEPVTECTPDATQPCSTDLLGICEAGTQTCNAEGFWGECIQDNQSVDEICDNQLDDNCDGSVDCDDTSCLENEVCVPSALPEEPSLPEENSTTTE